MSAADLLTAWEVMLADPAARGAWEKAVAMDDRAASSWDEVRARVSGWDLADERGARHHFRWEAISPLKDTLLRRLLDGDVVAMGFGGDRVERTPIPPAAWEGFGVYIDPDRHVGRLADGRTVTGLRFRMQHGAPAPSAPSARPRTLHDAYSEHYMAYLARNGFDPGDPSLPVPTMAKVENALIGSVPRDASRRLHRKAYGQIASRRGRRVARLKQD